MSPYVCVFVCVSYCAFWCVCVACMCMCVCEMLYLCVCVCVFSAGGVIWSWVEMWFLTSLSDVFYLIRLAFQPGAFEVDGQPSAAMYLIPLRSRASAMTRVGPDGQTNHR